MLCLFVCDQESLGNRDHIQQSRRRPLTLMQAKPFSYMGLGALGGGSGGAGKILLHRAGLRIKGGA